MTIKILAIDSSTIACSAALLIDETITERFEIAPRKHGELLLPMIEELLNKENLHVNDLDAIAFGQGPGSFTGLRIAASVTQGIAFAANLPVIPISTLQAMAQASKEEFSSNKTLVCLDARMQEIYFGAYKLGQDDLMQPFMPDQLVNPNNLPKLTDDKWLAIGDAWAVYSEQLEKHFATQIRQVVPEFYPHAKHIAKLAKQAFINKKTLNAEQAIPVYLRNQDAWKKPI